MIAGRRSTNWKSPNSCTACGKPTACASACCTRENAEAFAKALPPVYGESQAKLFSSHYPTAARSTPRLLEPVLVDLTVPAKVPPPNTKPSTVACNCSSESADPKRASPLSNLHPTTTNRKTDLIPRSPPGKTTRRPRLPRTVRAPAHHHRHRHHHRPSTAPGRNKKQKPQRTRRRRQR